MVLIKQPRVLLLDEPTAGLSPRASHDILASLRQVQQREKLTCIIVEHNLAEMRGWASRAVVMIQGRLVAEETDVAKLMSREYLEKHYF
jgi:energy-coupling factor transporter ATP-binding protein EcfA2